MENFIEKIYEIAFGDDAIKKGYSQEEVIARLKSFSDKALLGEERHYPESWQAAADGYELSEDVI